MSTSPQRSRYYRENASVLLVALCAVAAISLSYDPIPAGSLPDEVVDSSAEELLSVASGFETEPQASADSVESDSPSGRDALGVQTRLLERGLQGIESLSNYSATFMKQEKLNGVLSEPDIVKIKFRQEPFSIYMKWLKGEDAGQEVAYVDGENDNRLLLKYGGLKGRMIPTLKIHPSSDLAMSEARYPVTEMGLKKLIERILEFRYRDLKLAQGVDCRMSDDRTFKQHDCSFFEINYANPEISPKFRKSHVYICKETCLPICVKNYGWPLDGARTLTGNKLDEETLLECYCYTNVTQDDPLSGEEFELANTSR